MIEKFPFESSLHRSQPMQFPDVPVIKADALDMPIPDDGCDLIFASHIIEHLPDPGRFVEEIRRCSKRVYLEFPSRNRELMFAWSFHKWLVESSGGVLKFYRNDLPQLFGGLFHEEYDAALGAWCDERHEHLNTSIYCDSKALSCEFPEESAMEMLQRVTAGGDAKINFSEFIHRPRYSMREVVAILAQSMLPRGFYERISPRQNGLSSPAPLQDHVIARLMCLQCRNTALRPHEESIICDCGARYRQDRGVFDFDSME